MTSSERMTSEPLAAWARRRSREVLELTEGLVRRAAVSAEHEALLVAALPGLRRRVEDDDGGGRLNNFVHLPLLVHAGLTSDEDAALPLAVLCALVFRGVDVLDDLADGDALDDWAPHGPAAVNLAAATIVSALVPAALAELDVPPETAIAMTRTVTDGLLLMSDGQHRDLALTGTVAPDPDDVEASVVGKAGAEVAMFAALAAQLAGAEPDVVEAAAALGRAVGTAGQLASDCADLFFEPHSRDLAAGVRTLPIALHLARLDDAARPHFVELLDRARTSAPAQEEVRAELRRTDELRRCAFVVEVYRVRAERALERLRPVEPYATRLRSLVDGSSFFGGPVR